ncbi:MAG: glucose 1-dehydrogenase [Thermoproteota archaeon]|nr:glucose 1-dehydrogenase [Thermoproteota archaeon]
MNDERNINNGGKVVVVTGSSKGIGKAIAMEFAKAGYSAVINARNEEELKMAAEDISQSIKGGGKVVPIAGDISQEPVCISLIENAVKQFGRLDVLVNNAGISGESKKIHEITEKDWDEVIDVNLKGAFLCTREAVKNMMKNRSNVQGKVNNYSIINISSVHEQTPQPESAPYSASKGGMEMLTKTVALELADKGIRVNGIAPGAIATDMNKEVLEDQQKKEKKEQKIPVHRIGQPEEIAKVALFLASEDASYIAGTTIYVDGGLTLVS